MPLPEFNNNGKMMQACLAPNTYSTLKEYLAKCQSTEYFRVISPSSGEPFGPAFWFASDAVDWRRDTFGSAIDAPDGKQIPFIEVFPVPY